MFRTPTSVLYCATTPSVFMASRQSPESFKIAYHHDSEYLCQQEITGKRAAVEGNLQMPIQTEEIGGDLWLVFDISPFIPITPMMWPHFIAKFLILKRSKEVREGQFTYPMDTSTSPY